MRSLSVRGLIRDDRSAHMSPVKGLHVLVNWQEVTLWFTGPSPSLTVNELKGRTHSFSFGLTSSSCKVTVSWQGPSLYFTKVAERRDHG